MSGAKRGWLSKLIGKREKAARIIHLCPGPNCCRPDKGKAAYDHLVHRLNALNSEAGHAVAGCVRAACFNVCGEGPVAVVMPDNIWYSGMDPAQLDRVIDEHLLKGHIVAELAFEAPIEARTPQG